MPPRRRVTRRTFGAPRRRQYRRRSSGYSRLSSAPRFFRGVGSHYRRPDARIPRQLSDGERFVIAQLDPFDVRAQGAKVPDDTTVPSLGVTDVDIVSMAVPVSDPTFMQGMAFRPRYTWGMVNATPASTSTVSWGAAYVNNAVNRSKRSEYGTNMELDRPVAHAIRISCPMQPTTVSGFLHIALVHESLYNVATWQFPTSVAELSGCSHYRRVTLASLTQSPLTFINKWLDPTGFRYSDPASDTGQSDYRSFQSDYGWCTILLLIEGHPTSGTLLNIEHLLSTEAIPKRGSVLSGSPAATNSQVLMSGASSVSSQHSASHTEAEQDSYIQQGARIFSRAVERAGASAWDAYARPVLNELGNQFVQGAVSSMLYGIPGVNRNPNLLALQG